MRSQKEVEVLIIGAGTAGLSAASEVKRATNNFLVVDRGPLGTTCSRAGCMPSKILLQFAHDHKRLSSLRDSRAWEGEGRLNKQRVMSLLREQRDHFLSYALDELKTLGENFLPGAARFTGPGTLRVGAMEIRAGRIILATGSRPIVPEEWGAFRDRIVTTDELFEMKDLPRTWGVIGLGALGLEMGQALSRLDCDVIAFDKKDRIGGIRDPRVAAKALASLRRDFPIELGVAITVEAESGGDGLILKNGSKAHRVDRVLASLGRSPNFDDLDIERSGCERDKQGRPKFDRETMIVNGTHDSILIAGDLDGDRALLHEAADDGRIAGFNSVQKKARHFKRRVPIAISFTTPNIASIGKALEDCEGAVIGEVSFDNQGRSVILGENSGLLRIYAAAGSGLILGAELMAPAGEHIGQIIALAIEHKLSASDMLRAPFYHPTVEEGLRTALRDLAKKLHPERKAEMELSAVE